MKVSDIMAKQLTTVDPEDSLSEAATLMGERSVGSVVVCENGRCVGILTERDIVRALSGDYEAPQRPVIEWMTKDPTTVRPDVEVREALRVMIEGGFRHLPVIEGDRCVGIVSMRDVAGALTE